MRFMLKSIYQSDMYGFIEVEDYIFDQNSQIVLIQVKRNLKQSLKESIEVIYL